MLKKRRNNKKLFTDKQWKIIVGVFGTGLNVGLIILTLKMTNLLLSG